MADNVQSWSLGKKIFFFHPSEFTRNQVIAQLAQEEFEVYIVEEESKLRKALEKYPGSVMFASISEVMMESAWDELIRDIDREMNKKDEPAGVYIGIITSMDNENLRQKYLGQYNVNCGFSVIHSDLDAAVLQLVNILNSVNAKGRRNYIRLIIDKEAKIAVNFPMHGTFISGDIKDISVVGFSCSFAEDPDLTKNAVFGDIQFRLQNQLLKAEGIVFGSRMDGAEKVYVILFTQRVDSSVHTVIRKYIQSNLQNRIDKELD